MTAKVDGQAKMGTRVRRRSRHHTIAVTADTYRTATQEFDLKFAESKDITVKLSLRRPSPPWCRRRCRGPPLPASEERHAASGSAPAEPRSNVPAYVTLGLAVVGAGVGTVFGVQALGSKSDYNAPGGATHDNPDTVDANRCSRTCRSRSRSPSA